LSGSQYDIYFRKCGASCARLETGKMESYKGSQRYVHYNELQKCMQRSANVTIGHGVSHKNKEIQIMLYKTL